LSTDVCGVSKTMKRITVLMADDNRVVRNEFKNILKLEDDLEVVGEAKNGHEAVAISPRSVSRSLNDALWKNQAQAGWDSRFIVSVLLRQSVLHPVQTEIARRCLLGAAIAQENVPRPCKISTRMHL
jgi:hypothetical protein